MPDPLVMVDSAGNPLSVGLSVLWKSPDSRDFRVGWVRDVDLFAGKPAVRIDDGAEWDADLKGRTWSVAEWITDPKRIRPRREQPLPDPRIAELTAEVERLRALIDNPGDHVQTWTPTRDQIVGIAHARTVTITIPSTTIRDHLRARLEAPND